MPGVLEVSFVLGFFPNIFFFFRLYTIYNVYNNNGTHYGTFYNIHLLLLTPWPQLLPQTASIQNDSVCFPPVEGNWFINIFSNNGCCLTFVSGLYFSKFWRIST